MASTRRTKSARSKAPTAGETPPEGPIDPRALLLRDVNAFNTWRLANLGVALDLTGADLRGANLRKAFLAGATLDRAQLDDAALAGAQLSGASLQKASLVRADLRGACLAPAELVSAELAMSPIGSALCYGASLKGASLAAARFQEAEMRECDLTGADLTDCDFTDAKLKNARLDRAIPEAPPGDDDDTIDATWERFGREPKAVREGILRFGMMVFLAGDRNEEGNEFLTGLMEVLSMTERDVERLMPKGPIRLETLTITAPPSHWARRLLLVMMCGLASTTVPVQPMQLQVLGHFGEQLGFSDRAMARILGEELGLDLKPLRER